MQNLQPNTLTQNIQIFIILGLTFLKGYEYYFISVSFLKINNFT